MSVSGGRDMGDLSHLSGAEGLDALGIPYEWRDGRAVVVCDINLRRRNLLRLPDLRDVVCEGSFDCRENRLASLAGAPLAVGLDFDCSHNGLSSLVGGPRRVGGEYRCAFNRLSSLLGAPLSLGWILFCTRNPLETLYGAPPAPREIFSPQGLFHKKVPAGFLHPPAHPPVDVSVLGMAAMTGGFPEILRRMRETGERLSASRVDAATIEGLARHGQLPLLADAGIFADGVHGCTEVFSRIAGVDRTPELCEIFQPFLCASAVRRRRRRHSKPQGPTL